MEKVKPGRVTMCLRCPNCGETTTVFWKGLGDFPYITCNPCKRVSRSGAWKLVFMEYLPA